MIYEKLVFPALVRKEPEYIHDQMITMLEVLQRNPIGAALLKLTAGSLPKESVDVFGLEFPNVLGMAAGFDKDARVFQALGLLGFGHIEIGTITPEPQSGNAKPRIFRLKSDQGLINRMGFPNDGLEVIASRIEASRRRPSKFILGASIGKQKDTPIENAYEDYVQSLNRLFASVDYFAINISSPNTPRLRELQSGPHMKQLITELGKSNTENAKRLKTRPKPLLLKISPDLDWSQLDTIIDAALNFDISGLIATNTTSTRENLKSQHSNEIGGLSGRPLSKRCNEIIAYVTRETSGKLPIIGVGGIFDQVDVQKKLDAGASLVQLYTGMIYRGPRIAGGILRSYHR